MLYTIVVIGNFDTCTCIYVCLFDGV